MAVHAIVFDVYKTLLEVAPPPPDAEAKWANLWQELLSRPPAWNLEQFRATAVHEVGLVHEAARARGISFPEVWWPAIVLRVLPEVRALSEREQDEFVFRQVQTGHQVRMNAEAANALRRFHKEGHALGIASNAQQYTLREFGEGLASQGLTMELFAPDLCFWSFAHGFSKPDPHVFQLLSARLARRGIRPDETLMVGDRLDNDIEPARKFGWLTWQITSAGSAEQWTGLVRHIIKT